MSFILDRKEFLLGLGLAALSGCTFGAERKITKPAFVPGLEEWPKNEDLKARFVREINTLPPSNIKTQLQTRILRYLQQPAPFNLQFSGVTYRVQKVQVNYEYAAMGDQSRGYFTPIVEGVTTDHQAIGDHSFALPLLIGVREEDKNQFPKSQILSDGTPVFMVNFLDGRNLFLDLHPVLAIGRSTNLPPGRMSEFYQFERFGLVKEACGWLLNDTLLEGTIEKMQTHGLKSKIQVRQNATGNIKDSDVTMSLIKNAVNNSGRTRAILDLAGYLLAFRVAENSDYYQIVSMVPNFKPIMVKLKGFDYGEDAASMLYRASAMVFDTPELAKVHYAGDMTKIP